MIGFVLKLPPAAEQFFTQVPPDTLAAYALILLGWIPILGVIIWGSSHLWLDYKQEQFEHHLKWVNLDVRVPQTTIQTPKGMENFFSNLAGAKTGLTWKEIWIIGKDQARFSFEIVSNGGDISFIIRMQEKYRDIVEADLYAQYPEAQITEVPDYTGRIAKNYPNDDQELFGGEVTLSKPHFFPIRTFDEFEHQGEKDNRFKDPLLSMLELMGKMQPGEHLWLQVIIKPPSDESWVQEGLAYLSKVMGKDVGGKKKGGILAMIDGIFWFPLGVLQQVFGVVVGGGAEKGEKKADDFRMFKLTPAEKVQIDAITEKISKIGWRTKIRWVGVGPKSKFRKGVFASGMKGSFQPFNSPILNQLSAHGPAVPKDDYIWQEWVYTKKQSILAKRYASRSFVAGANPCILNAEELATIFHFPTSDTHTPVLSSLGARRSEAPGSLPAAPLARIGQAAQTEPTQDDWKRVYLDRHAPVQRSGPSEHGENSSHEDAHHVTPSRPIPQPILPKIPAPHDDPPSNLPV